MRWRPVEGYEGLYEVSDQGDVRSLARTVTTARGSRTFRSKLLKQHRAEGGYYHVAPSREGKPVSTNVHVLVARAFIGPCPKGMEVCHRDGSRTNNHFRNLRYGTRKSNAEDRKLHGTNQGPPPRKGEENPWSRLTEVEVVRIRRDSRSLKAIAQDYGVHFGTIHCVKTRKTWGHVA